MVVTKRQHKILDTIIQEYIRSARPVSSRLLDEKYDFGIKPPSLRIEMQRLTQQGYITQPHTSAGRIPTDKGYRFFVDELLSKILSRLKVFNDLSESLIEHYTNSSLKEWGELVKKLAEVSDSLVVGFFENTDIILKEGWEQILKKPEFKEKSVIFDFTRFLQDFERWLGRIKLDDDIKVYIGRENPFRRAEEFSTIITRCCIGKKEGVISLLGPKRMRYDKNIMLMGTLLWKTIKKKK